MTLVPPRLPVPTRRYGVILADPPWKYSNGSNEGAAALHYPVMTLRDICALPVSAIAAEHAVLLLWGTWPKLDECLRVVRAWGFTYVTGMPWVKIVGEPKYDLWGDLVLKPQYGVGYWLRGATEFVLIGKCGKPAIPDGGAVGLLSENFGHSRKPDNLYDYAQRLPGPYIELFARRKRDGWDAWGNEIENTVPA